MAEFINTVDVVGDKALSDSMINKTITECHDNSVTKIGKNAFCGCQQLTNVKFPAATNVEDYAFESCRALKSADFTAVTKIGIQAFYAASALDTLILRGATVCVLSDTAMNSSAIKSGTGYIYVPRTLADGSDGVEAYKAATNWSAFSSQIRAIEDFPEICGG